MSNPDQYRVIGLMSGSSLDGLDIACCDFELRENGDWGFSIPFASCVGYDADWQRLLSAAHHADGRSLWRLHADFGNFCGRAVRAFIDENGIEDSLLVASHGHTVFHFPHQGFTAQIGDGAALAARAGLPVICDFRSGDVAKSGQGAPLVPVGDRFLFKNHKFLLNLGGIANITVLAEGETLAFDICSANQVLDYYARQNGMAYDKDGTLAKAGALNADLLQHLNDLPYCAAPIPKSLDNGYSRDHILPLIEKSVIPLEDKLHTYCEHIAWQIGKNIREFNFSANDVMLATGGGALNTHLINRIRHYAPVAVDIPDDKIVHYKEALVFAFMGLLRWRNETNIFRSVTGATTDSIAGAIYLP